MKLNNSNLTPKEIVNIVKYSTIGILVPMFIIGIVLMLWAGHLQH